MSWFFIAILGYFLLALVVLLDKVILESSVPKPAVYTFYSTAFLLPLFCLFPFTLKAIDIPTMLWGFASGLTFVASLWTMFISLKHGEASHLGPFIGAFITLSSFGFGSVILNESLSLYQQLGMFVLIVASFFLAREQTKKRSGFHIGYLWAILSGVLFGFSHVAAKFVYDIYPFVDGLMWTKGTAGVFGLFFLLHTGTRKALFAKPKKKLFGKKQSPLLLVFINKSASIVANLLIQYAIAVGSVTLVNALGGLQYGFLFLMILLTTKFWPKFLKEFFTKKELIFQSIGILLLITGAAFFAF